MTHQETIKIANELTLDEWFSVVPSDAVEKFKELAKYDIFRNKILERCRSFRLVCQDCGQFSSHFGIDHLDAVCGCGSINLRKWG